MNEALSNHLLVVFNIFPKNTYKETVKRFLLNPTAATYALFCYIVHLHISVIMLSAYRNKYFTV